MEFCPLEPAWGDVATWVAGAASVFAGVVALWLGLHSIRMAKESSRQRAAAVATLIGPDLYDLRAYVDVVAENAADILSNPEGYAAWYSHASAELLKQDAPISERVLPLLQEYPSRELWLLVLADKGFAKHRKRYLLPDGHTAQDAIGRLPAFIEDVQALREVVTAASDANHRLSGVPGAAPWIDAERRQRSAPRRR